MKYKLLRFKIIYNITSKATFVTQFMLHLFPLFMQKSCTVPHVIWTGAQINEALSSRVISLPLASQNGFEKINTFKQVSKTLPPPFINKQIDHPPQNHFIGWANVAMLGCSNKQSNRPTNS